MDEFIRTEWLVGKEAADRLWGSSVAVFGIGGVGSYVTEALARAGVGCLHLTDSDEVDISNINRQLIALHSTLGKKKVYAARERIADIQPLTQVVVHDCFYNEETAQQYPYEALDYIVDAIDTVSSKLLLIEKAKEYGIPVISCMGVGNKLHPELLELADISETRVCPLARTMRRELKKRGISHCRVLYSSEKPIRPALPEGFVMPEGKRQVPGSISFVPSAAGLMIAGAVVRDLICTKRQICGKGGAGDGAL